MYTPEIAASQNYLDFLSGMADDNIVTYSIGCGVLYSEFINAVAQKFQPEIIMGHSVGGMASVFLTKVNVKIPYPSVRPTFRIFRATGAIHGA